jgi:hypothetical protein
MSTIDRIRGSHPRVVAAVALVAGSVFGAASTAGAHPGVPGEHEDPEGISHWLTSAHHLLVALGIALLVIGVAVALRRASTRSSEATTMPAEQRER